MVNSVAVSAGYGVRIGLEDNIWYDNHRTRLATNVDLLKRIIQFAEDTGRCVLTPQEGRKLLGLKTPSEGYGMK